MTEIDKSMRHNPDDERVSYRGPIKRLLISPEIGALIGTAFVWAFFWGNGDKFGTAGSTANFLDVAAPLGIMAIAVALLMIGGEFDLSAGVMTGLSGVTIALMAKYFTAGGISLWVCIPAAFVLAGCVGWWNGFLVNRTGLPSFIVTLSSFFVIKGANLVFAKRINDKVNVADVNQAHGFKFFKMVLAGENVFGGFALRDAVFLGGGLLCLALMVLGLIEQSLVRSAAISSVRLVIAACSAVAVSVGVLILHRTDSIIGNFFGSVVALTGAIAAIVFYARAKFEVQAQNTGELPKEARSLIGLGLLGTAVAISAGQLFDRSESRVMLSWFPVWLRISVAVVAGLLPIVLFVRRIVRGEQKFQSSNIAIVMARLPLIALVTLTGVVSLMQLTTVQAVRAVVIISGAAAAAVGLFRARKIVRGHSTKWFMLIGYLMALSCLLLALSVRSDSSAARFRGGLFAVLICSAAAIVASTLIESRHQLRTSLNPVSDRFGSRLVLGGMLIGGGALAIRLVFSDGVFRMSVFWWLLFTAIGSFVLVKTKYGNWIYAVGGNIESARAAGVPVAKVKTALFMTTALMGAFVGALILIRFNSVQAQQGDGQEFEYIIAAVVGGNLMTGGYGSVVGASLGALIMAISKNGIPAARWNQDGRFVFLGAVLLVAVLVNNFVRKKAIEQR